jgi:predicted nucleotidyltransferase
VNFEVVIRRVVGALENQGIRYALIGGFAMALRGVQRATMDMDFILMLEDMEKADRILGEAGYAKVFQSPNVSHYLSTDRDWGRIDILHAFRRPTLGMLQRAESMPVLGDMAIRVVQLEDIIGLKVQATVNDPSREARDWSDIRMIVESARDQGRPIDWSLISDYLGIFRLEARLEELKRCYGQTD